MLKRTLSYIMEKMTNDVYRADQNSHYVAIDKITALLLLDMLEHLYKMEDQHDGTR